MNRPARAVRTLIVDDEALARRRLRTILSNHAGVEVIGEAANGTQAVAAVASETPDLLMLDIQMPGRDGFDVLRAITDAGPRLRAEAGYGGTRADRGDSSDRTARGARPGRRGDRRGGIARADRTVARRRTAAGENKPRRQAPSGRCLRHRP